MAERKLPDKLGMQSRELAIDPAALSEDSRTVEVAFSSELPYERWWGTEILDHSSSAIRLGRLNGGGAVLVNHDPDQQVGVIERAEIGADRVARAVLRFGKSEQADAVYQDVKDGIRRLVSVGYCIHRMVLESEDETGATYRVTDWEPFEVSIVAVPADPSVGVGRSETGQFDVVIDTPHRKEKTMTTEVNQPSAAPTIEINAAQAAAVESERTRVREISALGKQFQRADLADKAVADGQTLEAFRMDLLQAIGAAKPVKLNAPASVLGLSRSEAQRYSLFRAIKAMALGNFEREAAFEYECHRELVKRAGEPVSPRSIRVPYDIQKRDLSSTGGVGSGGALVATDNIGSSFIEVLRGRSVAYRMGATQLPGLQGNVTIPKQSAAATAFWLSTEATAITESQQTFAQVSLSPKNVGAYTELSRQLMLQNSPSAEALVMADLAAIVALAVDSAVLSGSGASGQPTGIINTAGIGSVTGTSIAYAGIVEFQTDVAAANAAVNMGALGYATTAIVAGLLKQRVKFTSTASPIWEGNVFDGTVDGMKAMSSSQLPASNILFGDWSQVVVGEWGNLEIDVNPYANFAAAITGVRAIYTIDVGVRNALSFSLATGVT